MKAMKVALASVSMVAGMALPSAAPLMAQSGAQAPEREYKLSRAEQSAIGPLIAANLAADTARKAGQSPDWGQVRALLPAAEAAAKSNDARYLVARIKLNLALGANDIPAQEAALTALIANASTPASELETYRNAIREFAENRAQAAFNAGDFATAEGIYRDLLKTYPSDERLVKNLGVVQQRMGNTSSIADQIKAAEAAGGVAAEELYQRVFATHYNANQRPQAAAALVSLLRNYPTPANWKNAIAFVGANNAGDRVITLDTLRLALVTGAIAPSDYRTLATELNFSGLPGETKAVIDAGVAAGALRKTDPAIAQLLSTAQRRIDEDRTGLASQIAEARRASSGKSARIVADALYGYGRYGEAADLYRVALAKGGEDADLVNTRLGASLVLAGQRTEAEAALRAVTGKRAELAQLWLAWLTRRTG